ncbi:MAG: alpha/beta hydrolase [Clostridia bacterium]|nr:alpha/beta hydrolase [Clostridia bacterium]
MMKHETLHIFPNRPWADLITYLHESVPGKPYPPRRAMIVCPGGGYAHLSTREDEPIALTWANAGFQTFILHYGINENAKNFGPLVEACLAIRYVREHAEAWNIDPDRIFITGFSAGGHLAASAGTLWDHEAVRAAFGDVPTRMGRPDGTVLCYHVISSGEFAHRGSMYHLTRQDATDEEQAPYSLENFVDADTAPSFLWHTANDPVVPSMNSILYAAALAKRSIPYELHIYPDGVHGLSLCDERTWDNVPALINPVAHGWVELAVRWAKNF